MIREEFYNHSYYLPIEVCWDYDKISKFKQCPRCLAMPRIWAFDNGKYARCVCFGVYDSGVKATDVMTHHSKHGGDFSTYRGNEELIENWNNYINTL